MKTLTTSRICLFLFLTCCGSAPLLQDAGDDRGKQRPSADTDATADSPLSLNEPPTKDSDDDAGAPVPYIPCACQIEEYDPAYIFRDYELVEAGEPHSQGEYPMFTISLRSPIGQAGRRINVIFQYGRFTNESADAKYKGKPCSVALPEDFLEGDYKTIIGDSVQNFTILPLPGEGDTPYGVEEPILLGGYIVGDISGGVFTPLNWNVINIPDALYDAQRDDPSLWVDFVHLPKQVRTYDENRSALLTPTMAHLDMNCGGMTLLNFRHKEEGPHPTLLGINAEFNPVPRKPIAVQGKEKWTDGISLLVTKEGKPTAPVTIQSVYEVDILNDGTPDIVVFAEHTEWTGRCHDDPKRINCNAGSQFDVDKSYGLVAVAMDGKSSLENVNFYFSNELRWELDHWMFADVNGDNTLEFIYDISYFEGSWAGVLNMALPNFPEFISMDCML